VCFIWRQTPPQRAREKLCFQFVLPQLKEEFSVSPPPLPIIIIIPSQKKEKRHLKLCDYLFIPVGGSIALLFLLFLLISG
jgi:hypothetical protein